MEPGTKVTYTGELFSAKGETDTLMQGIVIGEDKNYSHLKPTMVFYSVDFSGVYGEPLVLPCLETDLKIS